MARYLIGMTGASGAIHGVDFLKRCPGEKFLVMSDWARHVLLTLEQRLAEHVDLAFFKINVWVGAVVLAITLAARMAAGGF